MKVRKLPVTVDAWPYDGSYVQAQFIGRVNGWPDAFKIDLDMKTGDHAFTIHTLEGDHLVTRDDWVIKGVAGEFYPCKRDIFNQTYEIVDTQS